jgi:hypothetical protein
MQKPELLAATVAASPRRPTGGERGVARRIATEPANPCERSRCATTVAGTVEPSSSIAAIASAKASTCEPAGSGSCFGGAEGDSSRANVFLLVDSFAAIAALSCPRHGAAGARQTGRAGSTCLSPDNLVGDAQVSTVAGCSVSAVADSKAAGRTRLSRSEIRSVQGGG